MPLEPAQVDALWMADEQRRINQRKRWNYYTGVQPVLELDDERLDGSTRNKVVTNWIKYIVDAHSGFIASSPFKYIAKDSESEDSKEALSNLYDVVQDNELNIIDLEHVERAVLMGWGVEVHGVSDGQIVISSYDPRNWAFVFDEDGAMIYAIYKVTLPANSSYKGEIISDEIALYTVYDDKFIYTYERKSGQVNPIQENRQSHYYGRPPVVLFRVNKPGDGYFISDALLTQQDVFNVVRSANADDVTYNVDSLLAINGYEPSAFFEADDDGVTFIEKLREHRILPLNENAKAEFLERGNPREKVEYDLELTRSDIHMMSRLTDLASILAATGTASGIALKLKLQPQIEQASVFTRYLESGLRDRISLINTVWEKQGKPQLLDYEVEFTLNIPTNEQEIWNSLPSLDHVMSIEDQLKLVPSVRNPEKAAKAKLDEMTRVADAEVADADDLSVDPGQEP